MRRVAPPAVSAMLRVWRTPRDPEGRHELDDGNATGDERERGANPSEEGALVGEG